MLSWFKTNNLCKDGKSLQLLESGGKSVPQYTNNKNKKM